MKTSQKLGLAAVVVFVISHLLPAYEDGSGFACFQLCWSILWRPDELSGGWAYYSGFVLVNILMPVAVIALFVTKRRHKLWAVVSIVCFLDVLSWAVMSAFQQPSELGKIKMGYYVWLAAYGLLVAAHLWKEPGESFESMPPVRSVT